MIYNSPMEASAGADSISTRAVVVRLSATRGADAALGELGLRTGTPTLVLVGGAGGMSAETSTQVGEVFGHLLVPFIEKNGLAVIDGGTSSGIMEIAGVARTTRRAVFPLIGVLPEALVPERAGLLQKDHTHFLLTPGHAWGDEVTWISALATALSGPAASLTLLVNGGEIAWRDAAASVAAGRPVLVADGSGRTADEIARTATHHALDPRAVELLKSHLVTISNPFTRPEEFMDAVRSAFSRI